MLEITQNEIPKIDVKSSCINSIGYFNDIISALEIEFTQGDIYRYFGVTKNVFKELEEAESKGKYFHRWIRGRYTSVKITSEKL